VAKVSLSDVQVTRVFWEGKGAQVVEKYTTKNGERETRYALFFDQPHGLQDGQIISVDGLLSANVDEFTKRDGSIGHAVNLKLNNPQVSKVDAGEKLGHAAINQVWPSVASAGVVEPGDGAPF